MAHQEYIIRDTVHILIKGLNLLMVLNSFVVSAE